MVRQIETLLLEGVLRPGDKLPAERELAKKLDVSRPILREALKVLDDRDLIVTRHGEGTFVADIVGTVFDEAIVSLFQSHDKAAQDYLEFRRDIDGISAAYAAERATEADRTILTRIFNAMRGAHDKNNAKREFALDVEFHTAVGECAHNIILIHTLRSCYRLLSEGVFYNREMILRYRNSRDLVLQQHGAIYQAIMDADPDAARNAAQGHIDYVAKTINKVKQMDDWRAISALRLQKLDTDTGRRSDTALGRRQSHQSKQGR